MDRVNIEPILDYYIDYEFQTRMMDNSIKGKGRDESKDVLDNGVKIRSVITDKKINTVWDKLIKLIKNNKSASLSTAHSNPIQKAGKRRFLHFGKRSFCVFRLLPQPCTLLKRKCSKYCLD